MGNELLNIIFKFLSFSPGPFWLILFFIPMNKNAMLIFDGMLFLFSLIFSILVIPDIPMLLPIIADPTMEAIRNFLGTDKGTVGAWNHMILGDLWIGRWIVHDAVKNKVHAFIRAPFIAFTLFFGPFGLCCYLMFRMLVIRKFKIADS